MRSVLVGLGIIAIFTIGCGGKDTEIIYKTSFVLCPSEEVECDCSVLKDPREVEDLYGLQIHSLDMYTELSCYDQCEQLRQFARETCKEKLGD